MSAQPGSPVECFRCKRRLSQRSADSVGCPFCGYRADLSVDLEPRTGETICRISETHATQTLPRRHSSGRPTVTVHDPDADCGYAARGETVKTSVEAVREAIGDRSISLSPCSHCGEGLL